MSKSIDDEYRDWWRETGREMGNAYDGPAVVAEAAFNAGAEVIIERLRSGDEPKKDET